MATSSALAPAATRTRSRRRTPATPKPKPKRTPLTADQQALAVQYLPMARSLAARFARRLPRERDSFRSAALLALVETARAFDPARGVKFGTYAQRSIWRELVRELWRVDALGLYSGRAVRAFAVTPLALLAADPAHLVVGPPPFRGFAAVDEADGGDSVDEADALERILARLAPGQAYVCRRLYLDDVDCPEIARELGRHISTVRRQHERALAALRAELEDDDETDDQAETDDDDQVDDPEDDDEAEESTDEEDDDEED